MPPAGFDLGNSPLDYTPERVAGQQIVFTTTNGTATLAAAEGALAVYTGALVNLEAVAQRLIQLNAPVTLAAAGANGRPVLDDLGCAGMIIQRIQALGVTVALSDGAQVATTVARRYESRTLELLRESFSGRALLDVGLGDDLHHARNSVCWTCCHGWKGSAWCVDGSAPRTARTVRKTLVGTVRDGA